MVCIILAAGYATRLYPLTENKPKPLLEIGGRTILDMLIDNVDSTLCADEYVIVSNHKFYRHFTEWAKGKTQKITVIDDGTNSNEERLGAVRDMLLAVEKLGIDDDIFVAAGDNVLDFSLNDFVDYAKSRDTSCVMRYYEPDKAKISRSGCLVIDENEKVLLMQEKPENPASEWCCPPFYYYKSDDLNLIRESVDGGCPSDSPGGLVEWLCVRTVIHAYEMNGKRYDIGNLESYRNAISLFSERQGD